MAYKRVIITGNISSNKDITKEEQEHIFNELIQLGIFDIDLKYEDKEEVKKKNTYRDRTYWIIYNKLRNKYPKLSAKIRHKLTYNMLKKKHELNVSSTIIDLPIPEELEKVVI